MENQTEAKLSNQEIDGICEMIDIAVRQLGLRAAEPALIYASKLQQMKTQPQTQPQMLEKAEV